MDIDNEDNNYPFAPLAILKAKNKSYEKANENFLKILGIKENVDILYLDKKIDQIFENEKRKTIIFAKITIPEDLKNLMNRFEDEQLNYFIETIYRNKFDDLELLYLEIDNIFEAEIKLNEDAFRQAIDLAIKNTDEVILNAFNKYKASNRTSERAFHIRNKAQNSEEIEGSGKFCPVCHEEIPCYCKYSIDQL